MKSENQQKINIENDFKISLSSDLKFLSPLINKILKAIPSEDQNILKNFAIIFRMNKKNFIARVKCNLTTKTAIIEIGNRFFNFSESDKESIIAHELAHIVAKVKSEFAGIYLPGIFDEEEDANEILEEWGYQVPREIKKEYIQQYYKGGIKDIEELQFCLPFWIEKKELKELLSELKREGKI